mmetsp:Transcript_33386/g.76222  ORF Transcript_33386/g.76222 Transcript_33386/m.76222 type:complete len:523 (+) Transcript_33386:77-1645(+)
MVKFSFIALASALAAPSASAGTTKTIKLGHRNLRRGDPATKALLKKAAPYKKGGAKKVHRRAEDAEFEITGSYSLEFSQCIDVQTTDEDLFDEDIIGYAKAGQVVSTKSYVLFHVCTDDTCYLDAEDDLYMVDLGTYLANIATYHANKRTDFCEQCERNDEYCNPEEEEDEDEAEEEGEGEEEGDEGEEEGEEGEGEEGEEGEGEGEDRRMLKKAKRKYSKKIERKLANKNYIDCDKCQAYECFVDEEDLDDSVQSQNEIDNQISEWIGQLAECQETGVQWNGMDLYTGAMCSPYGDGVELAVFVNEECTMYTNQKTFASVYNPYANNDGNNANIDYVTYAEEYIKTAFKEVTPCKQVEYDEYNEDEDENNEEEEEDNNEASEYCQAVMQEDTVSFSNCQADEDEAEEEEDDQFDWSWYSSSAISAEKADDINSVCVAINAMDSESYGAHVYDEETNGSWYTRNKKGAIVYGDEEEEESMSGGMIALIAVVAVAAVGAAIFLATKKKPSAPVDTAYQGGTMS